jgi:membrane protein
MVLGVGFLLLVSLVVSAVLAAMMQVTQDVLPGGEVLWQGIEFLVSVGLITLLFALIYKMLPDVDIAWRDVWIGAGMTAVLFTLGKFLLGLYLGRAGVTSPYGAAGSLVLVLLWVYYSGLIFLFGAAFTKVHAASHDAAARPTAKAVFKESPWEPARPHGTETGHAPPSRHNQVRYRNGKMSDPSPPLPSKCLPVESQRTTVPVKNHDLQGNAPDTAVVLLRVCKVAGAKIFFGYFITLPVSNIVKSLGKMDGHLW